MTGCRHQLADKPGSFELLGDRVIKLGTNMYVNNLQAMFSKRLEFLTVVHTAFSLKISVH